MPTTGGALAFDGYVPPYEATVTKNLRDAGAIIIAKTGMTELRELGGGRPYPMPTNYNGLHGYGFSLRPAAIRARPPSTAAGPGHGGSSPAGTAASFWAANIGTETSGRSSAPRTRTCSPASSRRSAGSAATASSPSPPTRTPGPMAKTVTDAPSSWARVEGGALTPTIPHRKACTPPGRDYTKFLGQRTRSSGHRHPRAFTLRQDTRPAPPSLAAASPRSWRR